MSELDVRIQHKRDTEKNWEDNNPKLLNGEFIIVDIGEKDEETGFYESTKSKLGDGIHYYKDLPFFGSDLEDKVADLLYEAIAISKFTNNINTAEIGSTVTSVTLNWTTSKAPKTLALTLDGNTLETDTTATKYEHTGLSLTEGKTYKLTVADEKTEVSKTTTITFCYNVCYGVAAQPATIDSTFVLGLAKKTLSTTRARTVTYNAGEGQYLWYCIPDGLGDCTFTDTATNLSAGLRKVTEIDVTNSYGKVKKYHIYRSDYAGLGSLSVKVT